MKSVISESWKLLFKNHNDIASGKREKVKAVQAAVWQIKKEWIIK